MERYESDYSEDFEEEELTSSKPSAGSLGPLRKRGERRREPLPEKESRHEKFSTPFRQRAPASKSRSTGTLRRARRMEDSSRRSFLPRKLQAAKTATTGASPARERQLSAMNRAVRGLQNKLAERERRLEELNKENRLLTRLQKKQDREWSMIQRQEDQLPQILQRHEQEVKALRQQLRRSQEQVLAGQKKTGELQDDVRRLSDANHKLEKVVGRKSMLERDQLTSQLQQISRELAEREKRVMELERGLEASGKTHTQEVKGLRARNRALASEAATLRDSAERLHSLLKEKTREMEVMNIYTQRIPRSMARPSPPPSPAPPAVAHQSSQTTLSCPPFKSVSMQHRSKLKAVASQTETENHSLSRDGSTQTEGGVREPTTNPATVSPAPTEALERVENPVMTARLPQKKDDGDRKTELEAQRSKQELLQKLRELKTAPASSPLSPPNTRTSQPSLPPQSTSVPSEERSPPAELAAHEQERKRLLLAKLMAIDEGSDPNHVKAVPQQKARGASSRDLMGANESSTSSLASWSEVVENMHQGRPAHASDHDPFGSRTRLSGRRRGQGLEQEQTFLPEQGRMSERPQGEEMRTDYKPSFGRRATQTNPTPHLKPHPPPPDIASEHFVSEVTPSISRGELLPRRPKAAMKSHDVMPGAVISEPDDLEELVL